MKSDATTQGQGQALRELGKAGRVQDEREIRNLLAFRRLQSCFLRIRHHSKEAPPPGGFLISRERSRLNIRLENFPAEYSTGSAPD